MMADRIVFGVTPSPVRVLKRGGNGGYQARNAALLALGLHPATRKPLKGDGTKCNTCRHAGINGGVRNYWKCDLTNNTGGPATDIKLFWGSCVLWEKETTNAE